MSMTEKEAAGKWCPFARALPMHSRNPYQSAANRIVNSDGVAQILSECIGSRCMAWAAEEREELEFAFDRRERPKGDGWEPYSDNPNNCAWKRINTAPRKGFCGLVGSP